MICAKKYENIFNFVKVTHTILFFPDTVYIPDVPKSDTLVWYPSFLPLLDALYLQLLFTYYLHIIFIKCLISEPSVVSTNGLSSRMVHHRTQRKTR